jgi:hypothetical protein
LTTIGAPRFSTNACAAAASVNVPYAAVGIACRDRPRHGAQIAR